MTSTSLNPFLSLLLSCRLINSEASHHLLAQPVISHWCQRGSPSSARYASTFPMYCACNFPASESQGWRVPESRVVPPTTKWPALVALYKWPKQPRMPLHTLARMENVKVELSWNYNPTDVKGVIETLHAITDARLASVSASASASASASTSTSASASASASASTSISASASTSSRIISTRPYPSLQVTIHFPLIPMSSRENQRESWEFFHNHDRTQPATRFLTPLRTLLGELQPLGLLDWGVTTGLVYPKRTTVEEMREKGPWPAYNVGLDGEKAVRPRQMSRTRSRCGIGLAERKPVIGWAVRAERRFGEDGKEDEGLGRG